jgi:hypothetical protein
MREGYVIVNSVPTHVFTYGQWIHDDFDVKEIVLMIPGNPGLCGFYANFCSTLYNELDKQIPIWVLSHAGLLFEIYY